MCTESSYRLFIYPVKKTVKRRTGMLTPIEFVGRSSGKVYQLLRGRIYDNAPLCTQDLAAMISVALEQ